MTTTKTKPTLIFGAANLAAWTPDDIQALFAILEKHNVKTIDTAYIYPGSEHALGSSNAPSRFTIDTKAPAFSPGALSHQSIISGMETSLARLNASNVSTYYLHGPDPATALPETLAAISELHSQGKFKTFGLSNFPAETVKEIYELQKAKGEDGVQPTVFQGLYNAVARRAEGELVPVLRKLGISFHAYSPIAGGLLVRDASKIRDQTDAGRLAKDAAGGDLYRTLYEKPSILSSLSEWSSIASFEGISKAALAYRWVTYHSVLDGAYGDAVIIGASKLAQVEESLAAIEQGPLSEEAVQRIERVWKVVEADAPLDNYEGYLKMSGLAKVSGGK